MSWQTETEKTPVTANFLQQANCQFSRATQEPISNLTLMIQDTLSDTYQWFLLQTASKYIFDYVNFDLATFETTTIRNILLILFF